MFKIRALVFHFCSFHLSQWFLFILNPVIGDWTKVGSNEICSLKRQRLIQIFFIWTTTTTIFVTIQKTFVFWIVTNILMSYYIFRPLYSGKRRRLLPFLRDFHFLVRWRTSNAPIILTEWSTSFIEIAFSVQNNANVHLLVKFAYLKVSTQRGNAF